MLYMHFRAHATLCALALTRARRYTRARARADTFARFVSGYLVLQIRGTTVPARQRGRPVTGKKSEPQRERERREGKGLIAMPLHRWNPVRLSALRPVNIDEDLPFHVELTRSPACSVIFTRFLFRVPCFCRLARLSPFRARVPRATVPLGSY